MSDVAPYTIKITDPDYIPPDVDSIVYTDDSTFRSVQYGERTYEATALDDEANPLPGETLAWETSNASIATVDSDGVVTFAAGLTHGTANIRATAAGGAVVGAWIPVERMTKAHLIPIGHSLSVESATNSTWP